ncbi:hypothetical protein TNCV_59871 [Trichonephila clavipes]|nr:hypothetical protein TNCV_59871 [Trichonephila clavipes]
MGQDGILYIFFPADTKTFTQNSLVELTGNCLRKTITDFLQCPRKARWWSCPTSLTEKHNHGINTLALHSRMRSPSVQSALPPRVSEWL